MKHDRLGITGDIIQYLSGRVVMIRGLGIDIIEIDRIGKAIERDQRFAEKIFTPGEIRYCDGKHRQEIHYAARFAAKEAFFKALGTGWRYGMSWQEVSISNDELGKPEIEMHGKVRDYFRKRRHSRVHLSLSHTRTHATAVVIIE